MRLSGAEDLVLRTVLREQVVLHLGWRWATRAWLVVSPMGWAHTRALVVLAVLFALYDAVLAWLIRRGRGPSFRLRWALDAVDVAVWTALCPVNALPAPAVAVSQPLVVVLTFREGPAAGLAAVGGFVLVAASVRAVAGGPGVVVTLLAYGVLCVGFGWLLRALLRAQVRRAESAAARALDAQLVTATLVGRNDVVTGVGADLIDDLQTTIMRLTALQVDAARMLRAAVAQHKQQVAERTRRQAVYLRDAFDEYGAQVRAEEPAVARHVFFDLQPGTGQTVLSRAQADELTAFLTQLAPQGVVAVGLRARDDDGSVELDVAGDVVRLPFGRARAVPLSTVLLGPACLVVFAAPWSGPGHAPVPSAATLALVVGLLGYALAGLWARRRFGPATEPWLLVGVGVVFCAITGTGGLNTSEQQVVIDALPGVAIALGCVVRPRAAAVAAGAVALLCAGEVLVQTRDGLQSFAGGQLIWSLATFIGSGLVARSLFRLGQRLTESARVEAIPVVDRARTAAAEQELGYLEDVLARGERLAADAPAGPLRDDVRDALAVLRRRIADHRPVPDLSTSSG